MPCAKGCSTRLKDKKKLERVDSLMTFIKTATRQQMSAKLHDMWATPQSTITEARILLTLGADPSSLYVDEYGKKALEERIREGNVCPKCEGKYCDFLTYAGTIYEEMFEQTPIQIQRNKKIATGAFPMSLDGGGMRGLVSVVTLLFASRRILGDETLPEYFDWYCGTSTGSMLALSIAKGLTLSQCFFQYWDMKRKIFLEGSTLTRVFGNQVDMQTRNIEAVLLEAFPSETLHSCHRRLTVPALDVSTSPAKMHIFRNYSFHHPWGGAPLPVNDEQDVLFRDAARASSAAPTYFHPYEYGDRNLVDGSFFANCPLNVLFNELDQYKQAGHMVRLTGVLSVGTGEPEPTKRRYASGSNFTSRAKHVGHVSTLLLEQVVGHDQSGLEMVRSRCAAHSIPFFRLSPSGVNVRIDQIDDGKLMDMIWTTLLWLVDNSREVDRLGELLHKLLSDPEQRGKQRSNTIL